MIIVTGATGNVGAPTLDLLRGQGHEARGLCRHPVHPDDAAVDLADRAAVEDALVGATAVFAIAPPVENQLEMERNLIETAKRAGVSLYTRLSSLSANSNAEDSVACVHGQAEEMLEASGVPYVHIRANFFMQMFLTQASVISEQGVYATCCVGSAEVGFIDARDIASVAAAVLTERKYTGKTLKLTGPELLTFRAGVEEISRARGRGIDYYDMDAEEYRKILLGAGVSTYLADHVIGLYRRIGTGSSATLTDDVSDVTGSAPRNFGTFAADYADRFTTPEES